MVSSHQTTVKDGLSDLVEQEIHRREGSEAPPTPFSEHELAISILEDILKDVQYRLADRRHQRNSLLPLHSLPIELLQHIFMHTHRVTRNGDVSLDQLPALRLVCKLWARTIDGTPQLWAVINQDDHPALWQLALQRSQANRLTIILPYPALDDDLESFVELVTPHSWRWKSLKITLRQSWNYQGESLTKLFLCPAPALESCEIRGDEEARLPETPFGGHTPKLLSIYIEEFHMPWEGSALSAISSVTSLDLDIKNGITCIEQLCNILSALPQLAQFAFTTYRFDVDVRPTAGIPLVSLHRLTSLKLRSTDSKAASLILNHIDAPQAKLALFSLYKDLNEAYSLADLFTQRIMSFVAQGRSPEPPQTLKIHHDLPPFSGCRIEYGGFGLTYWSHIKPEADEGRLFKRVFHSLANLIGAASNLEIRGMDEYSRKPDGDIPMEVLLAVDEYCPRIARISCTSGQFEGLVAALAPDRRWSREHKGLEPVRVLFGRLIEVIVTSKKDHEERRSSPGLSVALLLQLARRRLEMGEADSSMARLEKVTAFLPDYIPDELQELRGVVPEVDLEGFVGVED